MLNHIGTVTIKTPRLLLRKFSSYDAENSYKNWASDPKTVRHVDCSDFDSLESVKDFISNIILSYDDMTYCFAVENLETGDVMGSIQLININDYTRKCEVGFLLGSKYWRQGFMTEGLCAVFEFAFQVLDMHRIEGFCTPENLASEKLMRKCKMAYEGLLRKVILINDNYYDGKLFAILKEDIFP